jgi:DNA-binding CsgD family transcriptional regulator
MLDFSNLDSHIAITNYHNVEKICRILFKSTPITYFCYQRLYADGSYTFLVSKPDLATYFSKNTGLADMWQFNIPFENISNGFILWDIAKTFNTAEQSVISHLFLNEFNLSHGIDVIEKSENHADFYCFASNNIDIYQCSMPYLRRFIFYFKQESHTMISTCWHEKFNPVAINLENSSNIPIFNSDISIDEASDSLLPINKFYLYGEHEDVYLTSQEKLCLEQLSRGLTAKEAASILGLSHRTIEFYIANLKKKLSCSQLTEAIQIARANYLIK